MPPPAMAKDEGSTSGLQTVGNYTLLETIGNGTFGSVRWAQLGAELVVAKRACAPSEQQYAADYLETEAYLNTKLCRAAPGSRHLAPFRGRCEKDGAAHLVLSLIHISEPTRP